MSTTAGDKALEHLSMALAASVPFAIADLEEKGGPKAGDYVQVEEFNHLQDDDPDRILALEYGPTALGGKKGDTAKMFALLTRVIAVASFCPGGITVFGSHFQGRVPGADNAAERVHGRRGEGVDVEGS